MSLYFMCCVFENCLVKQFVICLGVVVILLLNVMEVFSGGGVLCWIDRVWSFKKCLCCVCDPSVHLNVPLICFVYVFVSEVISSFKSLRLCMSAISMMFVKVILAVCMLVGMVVFRELCSVGFFVVGESPSVFCSQ